jgi:hypothetical protein
VFYVLHFILKMPKASVSLSQFTKKNIQPTNCPKKQKLTIFNKVSRKRKSLTAAQKKEICVKKILYFS